VHCQPLCPLLRPDRDFRRDRGVPGCAAQSCSGPSGAKAHTDCIDVVLWMAHIASRCLPTRASLSTVALSGRNDRSFVPVDRLADGTLPNVIVVFRPVFEGERKKLHLGHGCPAATPRALVYPADILRLLKFDLSASLDDCIRRVLRHKLLQFSFLECVLTGTYLLTRKIHSVAFRWYHGQP
jgi:hypothetical protein